MVHIMQTNLISYLCFSCKTEQLIEDPPLKSENFMQEFYRCRCSNCDYANIVMVYKPMQLQLKFPPFKLN
jgi:hypothetical protein